MPADPEARALLPVDPERKVPWTLEQIRAYVADGDRPLETKGRPFSRLLVWAMTGLVGRLSWEGTYRVGRRIGQLLYLLKIRRRVAMVNLDIAFGDTKTAREKEEIFRDSLVNMGRMVLFYLRAPRMDERFWAERHVLIGADRVQEAYGRGKGVIFLGAHIGAWDFSAGRLGTAGYPIRIIAKRLKNPVMEKMIVGARTAMNFGTIAHRDSMSRVMDSLANGTAVGVTIDQNMKRSQGVFVEWLGHPASTVRSAAWVAKTSGAPVFASWAYPGGPGTFVTEILEEVVWESYPDDPERELLVNTRNMLVPFERLFRQHPQLVHWIHRRYKVQPQGSPNPYDRA